MANLEPLFVFPCYMLFVQIMIRMARKVAREKNYVACYLLMLFAMPLGFAVLFGLTTIFRIIIGA